MSSVVALLRSRSWPRAVAFAVLAIGAAGCSSESTRFNDNPYKGSPNEVTGSVPSHAAPVARVESSALPPPTVARPATVAAGTGTAGGGRGMASYQPGTTAPEVTGSLQSPPPIQKPAPTGQWSWDGGTAVTVKQGETVVVIARRYGVPASAIEQANNIGPNGSIYPGQRLVIPHYKQASAPSASAPATFAPAPHAAAPRPMASRPVEPTVGALSGAHGPSGSGVHVVAQGDTLSKISKLYGKSIAEIARANNKEPGAMLKIGERLTIPGVRTSKAQKKDAAKLAQGKPLGTPPAAKAASPSKQVATAAPTESASVVTPAAETPAPTTGAVKAVEGAPPSFRWPAKGRVIAGYGPKTNGQQNDGINLAVPEGTPIKASEDGVVAYAGNELKGYGNLVLVRHSHGYVTAYAHAKELLVKRGDHIKRGQVIAKSGQTGNVDGPQLHFEIRKGPSPLDPMPLLHGG